ncbi:CDP-diacylglycerol--glycerol-3-phosphate 3-phosphatidyltransferase [Leptospira ryugenii]|uniref:CDP-diacylglycerol--glycerol-3-phosphate 3-phosphatidyltransferase n=1 Tax=Leptospira ryugenii TaxID=1917863 RepID=A0A2P2DY30_9LEPT|nr:CDP-diacylglycerol--glycerol-3-phosphate 3-phosphatidyltransferase [Leptospira ryugenii]GBF49523.1 CDP-diacylglycerol--glycerol-3-phosphate 3-phosphatidyltransferase [Leptospira ryugenii]
MEDWKTIANFPNFLTVLRVLALPFFVYSLFQKEIEYQIFAFVLFALASLTDLIDGYLARKWNQQTEFGKFLDPLADKFLVIGCFIAFLFIHEPIEVWMVVLIVGRDMLITFLRYIAVRSGSSLRTTMMGKVKTAFQMGAILLILVIFMLVSGNRKNLINEMYTLGKTAGLSTFQIASENAKSFFATIQRDDLPETNDLITLAAAFVPYFGMLLTTIITVFSGLRYLVTNYSLLSYRNLKRIFYDRIQS